ncbi:chlorite dismutase family protein [Fimbriimonas ginsengisoli]|uniref:Coproheme decarboxylase n=1 Tax=Fimbriimonas ginsengisoli Gsoil 348 TaxID=661478 RepID=A0A068NLL2_FIMGI|nr:chlorite dismutase family protein [Fimbriimonas ginsengisoli]AIE84307.1 Chlorite dismutase [Fimbriimonas ginsengisoli Gsoil 348]
MAERQLNLYATFAYNEAYFNLSDEERREVRRRIAEEAPTVAEATQFYSIFPARCDSDFLIWSAWSADTDDATEKALTGYATVSEGWRRYVHPTQTLWGYTRVSTYARGKSEQDMDPFDETRGTYFVAYPFAKTKEWYLMSMDARQGQMNEHIKLGKQYPEIRQLLLYSFGVQDQEFVVAYETEDLPKFSDLVYALRSTEARRHTALDTPLITGIHRTPEEFIR